MKWIYTILIKKACPTRDVTVPRPAPSQQFFGHRRHPIECLRETCVNPSRKVIGRWLRK